MNEQRVLKNAALLVAAQLVATPVSVLVNALMGRYLGAAEFGNLYLALTFAQFGFLLVDWGQAALLTSEVSRAHDRSGELLGSALLWRACTSALLYAALSLLALFLGYDAIFRQVLSLTILGFALGALSGACHDVIRGFERTDVAAAHAVGWQLVNAAITVPILLLGGGLRAVLLGQAACALLGAIVIGALVRRLGVTPLALRRETSRALLVKGTPFVFFGLALALQPAVDAFFMSRLATPDAVGWHAAARKLLGVLIYPANALIVALFPTLCRLHSENLPEYVKVARSALSNTTVIAVPIALGCFLYPDLGILIFSRESFGPAEQNLQVLSLVLALTYFSMPISSALMAAGRQRVWASIQLACVAVSLIADWQLVPWFSARTGNGGLGVCVAAVISEVLMVGAGLALLQRGVFDRALLKKIALALAAGVPMGLAARALTSLSPWLAAPLSVLVYAGSAIALGVVERAQLLAVRDAVVRRFR